MRPGLLSPRGGYALAAVLYAAGLGLLILLATPWPGAAAIGAGLLLTWRARAAADLIAWHEWNDESPTTKEANRHAPEDT